MPASEEAAHRRLPASPENSKLLHVPRQYDDIIIFAAIGRKQAAFSARPCLAISSPMYAGHAWAMVSQTLKRRLNDAKMASLKWCSGSRGWR